MYTDFVSDRNTALVYYNEQEGVSDVAVSDVMQSSIGSYPCYWYSQQYSDAAGFCVSGVSGLCGFGRRCWFYRNLVSL